MSAAQLGLLIPIIISLGLFAMIFGIVYLRNKERMAMIERGMDPRTNLPKQQTDNRSFSLFLGSLLLGSGMGLFIAFLLDYLVFSSRIRYVETAPIYFSMIAIFGGLGMFVSYFIENKANNQKKEL